MHQGLKHKAKQHFYKHVSNQKHIHKVVHPILASWPCVPAKDVHNTKTKTDAIQYTSSGKNEYLVPVVKI